MVLGRRALAGLWVLMSVAGSVAAGELPAPTWPDTATSRLEALALIETLNADLLSHDSATLTLDRWCDAHGLGSPAKVVAERVGGVDETPTEAQRGILKVGRDDPVRYRRVRLRCGDRTLSEADNWYVPGRLTPAMNRALDETDIAFGRAVRDLHFARHTLSARLLWSPLPTGWETQGRLPSPSPTPLVLPSHLLEHQAVLATPDGTPFSLVVERYTNQVLGFAPPSP